MRRGVLIFAMTIGDTSSFSHKYSQKPLIEQMRLATLLLHRPRLCMATIHDRTISTVIPAGSVT